MTRRVSSTVFIALSSSLVILIVIFPWILGVILVFGLLGYFYLEAINENLKEFLTENEIFLKKKDKVVEIKLDPLLNVKKPTIGLPPSSSCSVCPDEMCTRDDSPGHHHGSRRQTPSPKHSPGTTVSTNYNPALSRCDEELKIDSRLDSALSRFCTSVFDFYISPNWAPYETRKQLKLAFKKLLTNFAIRVKDRLITTNKNGEQSAEKFCREKLIPLFLYHLQETTKASHRAVNLCELETKQEGTKLKVRKLCREVLEKCLSPEDLKCALWTELCVSVLSDGVLWNLIKLCKNKIPSLAEIAVVKLNKSFNNSCTTEKIKESLGTKSENVPGRENSPPRYRIPSSGEDTVDTSTFKDPLQNPAAYSGEKPPEDSKKEINQFQQLSSVKNEAVVKKENVPLLDSYLHPVEGQNQPSDDIVSRWRPKLQDILDERDLLYCLIQYLKGQKALEYLQAVMDHAPDAEDYCKKILELEYLPCFCRSSLFLEKMGLSRVEPGIEPATETHSNGSRPNSGHIRSSSFGGNNTGLQMLKFEQGVVEGLPLYETASRRPSLSSGLSTGFILPGAGIMEPDAVFKRKPATLESTISKFLSSTTSPPRHAVDALGDRPDAAKRVGVDSKSYDDLVHPDVNMTVIMKQCDVLEASTEAVTSSISVNPWVGPILSGWMQLLHPYIKPQFDAFLEEKLDEFLTIELFVEVVDLISDAFLQLKAKEGTESNEETGSVPELPTSEINTNENSWMLAFGKYVVTQVIDLEFFAKSVNKNNDNITTFFVDALDVFVSEIS